MEPALREDQEGGLRGVFRVLVLPQHAPAYRIHQGAMPLDERGECGLIAMRHKPLQQLAAGSIFGRRRATRLRSCWTANRNVILTMDTPLHTAHLIIVAAQGRSSPLFLHLSRASAASSLERGVAW